jgi:hypothetical protein
MFNTTDNKGFQVTFSNGYTISVQFGWGNYCENRNKKVPEFPCMNAEIAVWDKDGNFIEEPRGWQSPEEVANYMKIVSELPSKG